MIAKETIELAAKDVLRWPDTRKWNSLDKSKRMRSFFGAPSDIIAELWEMIQADGPIESGAEPKHLLWALVLLKVYSTDEVHCALVGWPSRRTFTKWASYFIKRMARLKDQVIDLENRFAGLNGVATTNCFISVDGTDCPVNEPHPFDTTMCSPKFNGPALKYEVAVCIKTGWIVWTNGPFKGGKDDGIIFREGLGNRLYEDEAVEVDKGCRGDGRFKTPAMGFDHKERKDKSNARAQQEAVNRRMKHFNVLKASFRHGRNKEELFEKHGDCFDAIAVITQLKISVGGEAIFEDELEHDVSYF